MLELVAVLWVLDQQFPWWPWVLIALIGLLALLLFATVLRKECSP